MKPKITIIMVMSLDGIVLRNENEDVTKWTSIEDQRSFKRLLNQFNAIVTGRKSFFGKVVDKPYYVLTNSVDKYCAKDGVNYLKGTAKEILRSIIENGVENIALIGGPKVNDLFLREGLVDELIITVEPLLLGKCKHITINEKLDTKLTLINCFRLNNKGTILLHYKIDNSVTTINGLYLGAGPIDVSNRKLSELIANNQAFWDERAGLHEKSEYYNVENLVAGGNSLVEYEIKELGEIANKNILHLQCHIGTESVSLARLGAKVTGVDFSQLSIDIANNLATKCNIEANFICSNVYDIKNILKNEQFDVVYVNFGALICLNDIKKWAEIVSSLLKNGGFLYLNELHPISAVLSDYEQKVIYNYFDNSPKLWYERGSYSDGIDNRENNKTINNDVTVWNWTLGEIISVIAENGLKIEFLKEHNVYPDKKYHYLEKGKDNLWYTPGNMPSLPGIFSLKATKI